MKLNETNCNYAVVLTAFHGGGVVSYHKSFEAAQRAAKRTRNPHCCCGCCAIVSRDDLAEMRPYDPSMNYWQLCK